MALKDPSLLPTIKEAIETLSNVEVDISADSTWFMLDSTWMVSKIEDSKTHEIEKQILKCKECETVFRETIKHEKPIDYRL